MSRRVLFITDSLGLPRRRPAPVLWGETYINRLRARLPHVETAHIGMPGGTITDLHGVAVYYESFQPDIVVLQSGIVDCAPRALSVKESQALKRLKLRWLTRPWKKVLRRLRNIAYTTPGEFENTLGKLKALFPGADFYGIGIVPGCEAYEAKVPGISARIRDYNEILSRNISYLSTESLPAAAIAADFHHLTAEGHTILADRLVEIVNDSAQS